MKHYLIDAQIARDRMRQLRRSADHERLAQLAQGHRPGLGGRLLAGLGAWMIAGGTRLRARYAAEMQFNRHDAKNAQLEIVGY